MFNSKKIKLLSSTFLLSFLILFYIKNYPSTEKIFFKENLIRNLIEELDVNEICEKSDSNLTSYFLKPEYDFIFDKNGNKWANYIIEYLRNDDTEEFINNYYKRVLPFLIFIALPIFLIFFWIGYCCCCCCPCCCCKQKGRENCCRFFSFLVALIMNGIVIVGCVYGFATTKNFINSMNDTTCVVMKTYLDVIEGEKLKESPKWIGSQNILDVLNQIIDKLDHINVLINNLSENKEELDEEYNEYLEFQRNKEEEIKKYVVTNPNVNNNNNKDEVVPIYTKNRDEKINDLNSYLQTIVDSIGELTENMQILKNKDNIVDTKNTLNNAIDDIRDLESKFTEREDILNDWIKGQKEVNKYSKKGYYFFFVFIAGLAIISLILSLFLVGQVCFCFPKLFLHIIWNINQLLMILIFLLGGILGILGVLLTDGIDVFNYAISDNNLNETKNNDPIIFTGSSREYLNICFNGNGSIIEKLDIKTDEIDSLNSAFQSYSNFSKLDSENIIKSFNDFNQYYLDIKNNMNNMIYDETYNVYNDLLNFDKYTDSENKDSRQMKSNENFLIYDIWRFDCSDEGTNCKIINKYKDENMTLNYEQCKLNDDEFANLKLAADKYLVNFYKFDLNCSEQLENILQINNEYKTKLDNISTIAEISLYNAKNITNILNEVFYNYISGDSNILDILSCKFLKRDKNIILSELDNKFTSNVTKMSTDILTIACAMALGTFFLLIVINRYVDDKKKPSKKKVKKIIVQEKEVENNSDTVIENDDTVENV